jgi:hypothetical protein
MSTGEASRTVPWAEHQIIPVLWPLQEVRCHPSLAALGLLDLHTCIEEQFLVVERRLDEVGFGEH